MTPATATSTIWERLCSGDAEACTPWLRWHPRQIDDCVQARADRLPEPLAPAELEELRSRHRAWGADEASIGNLEKLAAPNVRVVIAGQQPGLLAGPLYAVYKALGAIALAESLSKRHPDLQFVPVFWVASEDHDFDEMRTATWPLMGGGLQTVKMEHPDWAPGAMVGTLSAAPLLGQLMDLIRETTPETEFRPEVLALLEEACGPDQTWEDAFCKVLLRLLSKTGLVVVSPLMKWVRQRGATILQAEARRLGESSKALLVREEALREAGLDPTLHRSAEAVNFFWIDEQNRRYALKVAEGRVVGSIANRHASTDPPVEIASDAADLAEKIGQDPERFSFNVVTRPLVQDSILPTVAQGVGPGEAAYFAQVEAAYEAFEVFSPVRYPRPQFVLVPNSVRRILKKYEIEAADALSQTETALIDAVARDRDGGSVEAELEELQQRHLQDLRDFRAKHKDGSAIDKAIEKLAQSMEKGFQNVANRFAAERRQQAPQIERAMKRVVENLRPGASLQERTFNPLVPFAIQHGLDWLRPFVEISNIEADGEVPIIDLGKLFAPPDADK